MSAKLRQYSWYPSRPRQNEQRKRESVGCRKICLYHDENSVPKNEELSGQYNLDNVCWTVCDINLKAGEHFIRESNILIFLIWHSLGKWIGANI